MGLVLVLETFASKSLSTISFIMQPADLINIDPHKNNNNILEKFVYCLKNQKLLLDPKRMAKIKAYIQ